MTRGGRIGAAALIAGGLAAHAMAEDAVTYDYQGSFDDATFAVESAIINRGLVVDHTSHVGDMLARTGDDLGAEESIFENADVYLFCSAVVSREVMTVDPLNIVHCPYNIFVMARDGAVTIGHRDYPEGEMQQVEDMLAEIVADALEG